MILPRRGREAGSCEPNPCPAGFFITAALGVLLSGRGCLLRWVRQRHNSAAQAGGLCGCGGLPNSGSLAYAVPFLQRVTRARGQGKGS